MFVPLLALVLIASDPVKGNALYEPEIGESAVLHDYDMMADKVNPEIQGWRTAEGLAKYLAAVDVYATRIQRERIDIDDKALLLAIRPEAKGLRQMALKKEELFLLPDMTKVKVLALARFMKRLDGLEFGNPDAVFVEVTDGHHKGKTYWVPRSEVRVPGKGADLKAVKPLEDDDQDQAAEKPAREAKTKSAPAASMKLVLIETSWEVRPPNAVQVHARVSNDGEMTLSRVMMTAIYRDAKGKMVKTGKAIVGDLKPGQSKAISTFDISDPTIVSYDLEFESLSGESEGMIPYSRPETKSPPRGKAGRRR